MEQSRGTDVQWLQESLSTLGYLSPENREIFDNEGIASGVLNTATVKGLVRYKLDHMLGATPSAGLEVVNTIRRELAGRLPLVVGPDDTEDMIIYQRNGGDLPTRRGP